ncbi:DUF3889 domain-containing protein [Bacillus salitolerans]|uniref:DUF3889 domain-containing protein n=1 Tax=Bacillus salitolerans TaxID=1437434 RepID=A0ABW4LVP4_9BACI
MKKRIAYPLICIAFMIGLLASYSLSEMIGLAEKPDYAKWSRMAVEIVKENYPDADVSDYKYEGRNSISEKKAQDTFLFQVKKDEKAFEVKVVVTFNPEAETLYSLSLEEIN